MKSIQYPKLALLLWLSYGMIAGPAVHTAWATTPEKTKAVIAMGETQVKPNIPSAREAAVADALKSAVETAVIGELPTPLLTEKFQALCNLIADRKDEFIIDYKVLQEAKTETILRVLVQATVSMEKIQQAMSAAGIVETVETPPRVLFLISEHRAGETIARYWWQKQRPAMEPPAVSAIEEIFESKGIPIIYPLQVQTDFSDDMPFPAVLSDSDAMTLGKRFNADAVVVGTAVTQETSNRMGENIRSVKATLGLRVLFILSNDRIEPVEFTATAADTDLTASSQSALTAAARKAGNDLSQQVMAAWIQIQKTTGEITVTLKGKNMLANLNEFRNALKKTVGVGNQRTLEIAADRVVLLVNYQGKSQDLANALVLQTFNGFGLHIYEVTPKTIHIELTPASSSSPPQP